MPSKRLPIVISRSYCAHMRRARNFQNGNAMLLPRALYLDESLDSLCSFPLLSVHSPRSVHPSGNPWSRSHSIGVSLLTTVFILCPPLKIFLMTRVSLPPPYDPPLFLMVTDTSSSCHSKNLFSVNVFCSIYL